MSSRRTGSEENADLSVSQSGRTVEVSGGTYSLRRSELVEVSIQGRTGMVPRPDLAGALLVKARAARVDKKRGSERHLQDLAVLFSAVPDPFEVASTLGARNCARVAAVSELSDPTHAAWLNIENARRQDAQAAHAIVVANAPGS